MKVIDTRTALSCSRYQVQEGMSAFSRHKVKSEAIKVTMCRNEISARTLTLRLNIAAHAAVIV